MTTIQILSWVAIVLLAMSHWMQVYKIWKHHEVRDLSLGTYSMLLLGYLILMAKATNGYFFGGDEWFWMVRQIASVVPITIVLWQIMRYKSSRYHDDESPMCANCSSELEPIWKCCPFCSQAIGK